MAGKTLEEMAEIFGDEINAHAVLENARGDAVEQKTSSDEKHDVEHV